MQNDTAETDRRIVRCLAHACLALSGLLCLAIAACYTWRLDFWAAVTVFPIWAWVLAGIVPVAAARRHVRRRWTLAAALAWCLVLTAFADHPMSLVRFGASGHRRGLRVVSLNCAGSAQALREAADLRPDVMLVQESPGRESLRSLARELFGAQGESLWGVDASIVARGGIIRLPMPESVVSNAVHARVTIRGGVEVEIVSLRLEPALVRVDLWSPDCWRQQTANRQRRRKQLEAIMSVVPLLTSESPLIIGGDFNAPPGDAVFLLISDALRDAFAEAGRGWGNTIINAAPFLRIDQIWLSPRLRAADAYSVTTKHSDHRMVVCDVAP